MYGNGFIQISSRKKIKTRQLPIFSHLLLKLVAEGAAEEEGEEREKKEEEEGEEEECIDQRSGEEGSGLRGEGEAEA